MAAANGEKKEPYDHLFKLLLVTQTTSLMTSLPFTTLLCLIIIQQVGDSGVGKTSLLVQFAAGNAITISQRSRRLIMSICLCIYLC
jgi:putative ribosome biogenesis GTPase RsgA